jgi:hypothetical protein
MKRAALLLLALGAALRSVDAHGRHEDGGCTTTAIDGGTPTPVCH